MRLIGVVSEVAADEVAPELVRGVHDDEAASRRVYDKITRPSNGTDELSDETDRLDVGAGRHAAPPRKKRSCQGRNTACPRRERSSS